jgi:dynein heavy chain, axonemal
MTTSKSYGVSNLLEDLKTMYKQAALRPSPVVFLITEADVREDVFLEYINQVLMTGEVAGLFPRDELEAIFNDLRPLMRQESPGEPSTRLCL